MSALLHEAEGSSTVGGEEVLSGHGTLRSSVKKMVEDKWLGGWVLMSGWRWRWGWRRMKEEGQIGILKVSTA